MENAIFILHIQLIIGRNLHKLGLRELNSGTIRTSSKYTANNSVAAEMSFFRLNFLPNRMCLIQLEEFVVPTMKFSQCAFKSFKKLARCYDGLYIVLVYVNYARVNELNQHPDGVGIGELELNDLIDALFHSGLEHGFKKELAAMGSSLWHDMDKSSGSFRVTSVIISFSFILRKEVRSVSR
ncbi:hypothetical protein CAPTEDRAFT_212665 [Capitella teleta]|uniref:Uncharacterized protein n=1 Tax=Capitella teleta TaxID=283909 RepID=R7UZ85_CAPTE|nr:hypothetical protein CAPTEDRAFT_212665 [Capitella teleta]|eukprot:ELU11619.1 hypothetical protein CAPTEDRAFT_212665 [Capitella teleta]